MGRISKRIWGLRTLKIPSISPERCGQASLKAPNSNTQITNKFQIPIFNDQNV
jgi:hypothetical protein